MNKEKVFEKYWTKKKDRAIKSIATAYAKMRTDDTIKSLKELCARNFKEGLGVCDKEITSLEKTYLDVCDNYAALDTKIEKQVRELWEQLEQLSCADEIRTVNGGMVCPWTIEGCALMREFKGIIKNVFGKPKEKVKKK